MWFIVGFLIGSTTAFHLGWYGKQILEAIKTLLTREPDPEPTVVTPLPPGYTKINNVDSGIISPKSPDQIDREEEERIRRLV